jgi:Protein of unknown function DUF262/Protein of unknown function (DUF1524)
VRPRVFCMCTPRAGRLRAMRADAYSVESIFDAPVQYRVPLYQRPYVWRQNLEDPSDDRLTPFWEDVRDTVSRFLKRDELLAQGAVENELVAFTDHFFGAVVLDKAARVFGGVPHQEVIDGQQRFTTAQLMIAAAERLAANHGFEPIADALRDLRLNAVKYDPKPFELHKLCPTHLNRVAYEAVMDSDGPLPVADDGSNWIREAYDYFASELDDWLADIPNSDRERQVKALQRVLRFHLKFVIIELEEGDNAQEIFESLNAQGTPLLAIDLVKNYVFRRATAPDAHINLDELNRDVWRELDDAWWRKEQRQGRFKRPRIELFLMHWLTLRKKDDVPAGGLFVEFQNEGLAASLPDGNVREEIEGFIEDAKLYRSLSKQPAGSVPRRFLDRLELMDTTTLYPVILRLFIAERDGLLAAADRDDVLRSLESWVVRRMISDYTAKNYNRTAVNLLQEIDENPESPHLPVIRFLRDATTDVELWPDDALVRRTLVDRPLYNRLKPVRRVRMLLEACEIERRLASGGYAEMHEQAAPQLGMYLTVEHVLPQKWRTHWPVEPAPVETEHLEREADREMHVHRLGNLTLVTKRLNPAVGNAAWAAKRAALDKHSIMHLNRDLVREHPDSWAESDVDLRGAALANLIIKHWPGPDRWAEI